MLNINELESRWKRYKIRSYIPHLVIFVSTLIIVTLSLTFFTSNKVQKEEVVSIKPQELPVKKVPTEPKPKETLEPIAQKEEKVEPVQEVQKAQTVQHPTKSSQEKKITLTPSLDFMKSINRDALPYYTQSDDETPPEKKNEALSHTQEESHSNDTQENKIQIKQEAPETINIKKGTTQDDIQHVLKRFKQNNNPALSLFVAQKYYDLGDYHNSYNYALITNEINNNIEESWIIFTKSLVKLGQKDMAIKTLKQYLEYSSSDKASRLLDEIVSGKFK
ncbi:MAG: hypothetical protein RBR54_00300 [Sulfurimonas sp.]|jgi:tetratricopeptide (TPR) repeat protein|nr:hypothetical protein [Sulfurimonas sp.]